MSILRKPLDAITLRDLEALVVAQARETGELEFKGTLPFQGQKGQPQTADRWIEKGDRLGEYARDQILAELVAFANADGGTLVLGLHETKDEPRRAERLEPLPNCDGLARRLIDATEDLIEPRMQVTEARAFPVAEDGSGYVVLRVGKSLIGPHRLTSTREFYIRRGERAARMNVREIKDLTLDLARSGDRLEAAFAKRHEAARREFEALIGEADRGLGPILVRATALPITPQQIPDLTSRRALWWTGGAFSAKLDGETYDCQYPAREFYQPPEIRLRALEAAASREYGGVHRLVTAGGTVEFRLSHPKRDPTSDGASNLSRIYIGWLIGLVAGVLSQVERFRAQLGWDAVGFGLECELWAQAPLVLRWNNDWSSGGGQYSGALPIRLPRYAVGPASEFNDLIGLMMRDLSNAFGYDWKHRWEIPWQDLFKA